MAIKNRHTGGKGSMRRQGAFFSDPMTGVHRIGEYSFCILSLLTVREILTVV